LVTAAAEASDAATAIIRRILPAEERISHSFLLETLSVSVMKFQ
jgi:hypothetical protein